MAGLILRQGRRTKMQRFLLDPFVGGVVALLICLWRCVPLKWGCQIGAGLGNLGYLFCRRRNRIADRNLRIAFPEMSSVRRKEIIKGMWKNFGRVFASMARLDDLITLVTVKTPGTLQAFKENPKGGFVISAHFGNWEIVGSIMRQMGIVMNPVYRPANNPWLEKILFQKRAGLKIPKGLSGSRLIIQTLQQKHYVAMMCDQKLNEGIAVPFFGKPAMTAPAVAHLALKYDVPIYPAFGVWTKRNCVEGYILEPILIPKTGTQEEKVYQIMRQINALFEDWITRYPEQWLWMHRRFDKKEYI